MNDSLTLPGTIPGLLRPGSVIIDETEGDGVVLRVYGTPTNTRLPFNSVAAGFHGIGDLSSYAEPVIEYSAVALDLSDATSRAHAAWWLAGALGFSEPIGAHWVSRGELGWRLTGHQDGPQEFSRDLPELAGLDPNDDTCLPDGRRRVDVEALCRVCMHIYGGAA